MMIENLVGARIVSDGEFGTIRFIGEVPPTKGEWYGVEWDNPSRGKHNGTHEGNVYFQTKHPTSGSFIRPKKVEVGVDLLTALAQRYGLVDAGGIDHDQMYVRGKHQQTTVEVVGAEKLNQKQSEFSNLKEVGLTNSCVNGAGADKQLSAVIPNVQELDVSRNLLASWTALATITRQLPHLTILNVSSNRLEIPDEASVVSSSFHSLKTLFLNRMDYNWQQVLQCMWMWPQIRQLHLCFNNISSIKMPPSLSLASLTLLNLEGNALSGWNDVMQFAKLPKLNTLILNDTGISEIRLNDAEPGSISPSFPALKSISLYRNNIKEWRNIDELNKLCGLMELTIRHNPLLEDMKPETARQLLIAKVHKLQLLNRTQISDQERKGAELDYLRMFGKEWKKSGGHQDQTKSCPSEQFRSSHPRYQLFIEKYGAPEDSELVVKSTALKNNLLGVNITSPYAPDQPSVFKRLPASMSIQKLKTLMRRIYKIDQVDYYLSYTSLRDKGPEYEMDNDMREIGFFGIEEGDTIHVTWR